MSTMHTAMGVNATAARVLSACATDLGETDVGNVASASESLETASAKCKEGLILVLEVKASGNALSGVGAWNMRGGCKD